MSKAPRLAMIFITTVLYTACGSSYVPISSGANGSSYYGTGSATGSGTSSGTGSGSTNTSASGLTGSGTSSGSSGSSGVATTFPGTGTVPTSTGTGQSPLISEYISGVGPNSTSVTISTAKILKMTFTPGVQNTNVAGTGASPKYSMLGVYITVNGNAQNTGMLQNGLYTGQAQSSPILDFSSSLSGALQAVTITISQPNNDYFCLNFGYYCPWTQVYKGQPWNGTLSIQTDSTVPVTSGTSFL